jgi:hypothetical protein
VDQPTVQDLIDILEKSGKEPHKIIQMLSSIIQQQMMYGGILEDKINYQIFEAKKDL